MRKKYRVGEGSEAGKWGEYGLSKSPVGVSEVMQGKEAGAVAYGWKEGKTDDCCLCSLPPPTPGLCSRLRGGSEISFKWEAWKVAGCRREIKEYTGYRWCSAQANYWSCSLGFKSFVMTKEQAPGAGNRVRGKRPCTRWKWLWDWASVEEMLQWSLQWSWCLKVLGQRNLFIWPRDKVPLLFLNWMLNTSQAGEKGERERKYLWLLGVD